MAMVKPLIINKDPSVIMKEGNPLFTTVRPLQYPIKIVITKVKIEARGIGIFASIVNNVIDILEKPISDPIDKSNSPAIINSATPTARIPISDDTWR